MRMNVDAAARPSPITLADLTRLRARCDPDAVALVDGDTILSFAELDAAAYAIALELQAGGVVHGDRVALIGPHGVTQVAAILACSLLGAAFVPLDAALPPARMQMLLLDARAKLVLAPEALRGELAAGVCEVMLPWQVAVHAVQASRGARDRPTGRLHTRAVDPRDVAYIIYTSGSTGRPKGVQIEHHALIHFFESYNEHLQVGPGDRCLNTGAFHFDVCMLDVFLPLWFGATVYLRPALPIASLLLHELASRRITHFYAVGTLLAQLTADGTPLDAYDLSALKVLQTGAEVCKPAVVNRWLTRYASLRFINSYGPTEATVGCTLYAKPECGPLRGDRCPIGAPHRGTDVCLLDNHGQTVEAPWIVGELLIGGAQLMRGYWNAPEATRRVFITRDGARYYRSGDLAYRDPEGAYWFVGRRDDQIKFLGHRLHLRELRDALIGHPDVCHTAAGVVRDMHGQEQLALVASVLRVPSDGLGRSLTEWMRARLPSHMVPGVLGLLLNWPRLPSGKADTQRCLTELTRASGHYGRGTYIRTDDRFVPLHLLDARGGRMESVNL